MSSTPGNKSLAQRRLMNKKRTMKNKSKDQLDAFTNLDNFEEDEVKLDEKIAEENMKEEEEIKIENPQETSSSSSSSNSSTSTTSSSSSPEITKEDLNINISNLSFDAKNQILLSLKNEKENQLVFPTDGNLENNATNEIELDSNKNESVDLNKAFSQKTNKRRFGKKKTAKKDQIQNDLSFANFNVDGNESDLLGKMEGSNNDGSLQIMPQAGDIELNITDSPLIELESEGGNRSKMKKNDAYRRLKQKQQKKKAEKKKAEQEEEEAEPEETGSSEPIHPVDELKKGFMKILYSPIAAGDDDDFQTYITDSELDELEIRRITEADNIEKVKHTKEKRDMKESILFMMAEQGVQNQETSQEIEKDKKYFFKQLVKNFYSFIRLPYVRQVANLFVWVMLLLPYIFVEGVFSAFYLVVLSVMASSIMITDYSLTRILSLPIGFISFVHFIVNFVFSNTEDLFSSTDGPNMHLLKILGLDFSDVSETFFTLLSVFLFLLVIACLISIVFPASEVHINDYRTAQGVGCMGLFYFGLTSCTYYVGVLPVLFMLFAVVLFFSNTVIYVHISKLLSCFITVYIVFKFVYSFYIDYIGMEEKSYEWVDQAEHILTIIGINSSYFAYKYFTAFNVASFVVFCVCSKLVKIRSLDRTLKIIVTQAKSDDKNKIKAIKKNLSRSSDDEIASFPHMKDCQIKIPDNCLGKRQPIEDISLLLVHKPQKTVLMIQQRGMIWGRVDLKPMEIELYKSFLLKFPRKTQKSDYIEKRFKNDELKYVDFDADDFEIRDVDCHSLYLIYPEQQDLVENSSMNVLPSVQLDNQQENGIMQSLNIVDQQPMNSFLQSVCFDAPQNNEGNNDVEGTVSLLMKKTDGSSLHSMEKGILNEKRIILIKNGPKKQYVKYIRADCIVNVEETINYVAGGKNSKKQLVFNADEKINFKPNIYFYKYQEMIVLAMKYKSYLIAQYIFESEQEFESYDEIVWRKKSSDEECLYDKADNNNLERENGIVNVKENQVYNYCITYADETYMGKKLEKVDKIKGLKINEKIILQFIEDSVMGGGKKKKKKKTFLSKKTNANQEENEKKKVLLTKTISVEDFERTDTIKLSFDGNTKLKKLEYKTSKIKIKELVANEVKTFNGEKHLEINKIHLKDDRLIFDLVVNCSDGSSNGCQREINKSFEDITSYSFYKHGMLKVSFPPYDEEYLISTEKLDLCSDTKWAPSTKYEKLTPEDITNDYNFEVDIDKHTSDKPDAREKRLTTKLIVMIESLIKMCLEASIYIAGIIAFIFGVIWINIFGGYSIVLGTVFILFADFLKQKKHMELLLLLAFIPLIAQLFCHYSDDFDSIKDSDILQVIVKSVKSSMTISILILVLLLVEYILLKINAHFNLSSVDKATSSLKFYAAKFLKRWNYLIVYTVLMVCSFFESMNIALLLYLITMAFLTFSITQVKIGYRKMRFFIFIVAVLLAIGVIARYFVQCIYIDGSSELQTDIDEYISLYFIGIDPNAKKQFSKIIPNIIALILCTFCYRITASLPTFINEVKEKDDENEYEYEYFKQHIEGRNRVTQIFNYFKRWCCNFFCEKESICGRRCNPEYLYHQAKQHSNSEEREDFIMNRKLEKFDKFCMRFNAIYFPHLCLIGIMFCIFNVLQYTDNIEHWKSFDVLHLILLIPILVSMIFKKGFVKSIKLLWWVVFVCIIASVVMNVKAVDDKVDENPDNASKVYYFYHIFGIRTCIEYEFVYLYTSGEEQRIHCDAHNGKLYPDVFYLLKDYLFILLLISIAYKCNKWGERYEKKKRLKNKNYTLTLFNYESLEIKKNTEKVTNIVQFIVSHFFSYFGKYFVKLTCIICASFHCHDYMCLCYIAFNLLFDFHLTKRVKRQQKLAFIVISNIVFCLLMVVRMAFFIPFADRFDVNEGDNLITSLSWDYDFIILQYIGYVPYNKGWNLVVREVLDLLFIFFLNRYFFHKTVARKNIEFKNAKKNIFEAEMKKSEEEENENLEKAEEEEEKVSSKKGVSVLSLLKKFIFYMDMFAIFFILVFALNRKDLISFAYLVVMLSKLYAFHRRMMKRGDELDRLNNNRLSTKPKRHMKLKRSYDVCCCDKNTCAHCLTFACTKWYKECGRDYCCEDLLDCAVDGCMGCCMCCPCRCYLGCCIYGCCCCGYGCDWITDDDFATQMCKDCVQCNECGDWCKMNCCGVEETISMSKDCIDGGCDYFLSNNCEDVSTFDWGECFVKSSYYCLCYIPIILFYMFRDFFRFIQNHLWNFVTYFSYIILVLQHGGVFLHFLDKEIYGVDDPDGSRAKAFRYVVRIFDTVGFNSEATTDFYSTFVIIFILWLRVILKNFSNTHLPSDSIERYMNREHLFEIKRNKQLLELDVADDIDQIDNESKIQIDLQRRYDKIQKKVDEIDNYFTPEDIENIIKDYDRKKEENSSSSSSEEEEEEENFDESEEEAEFVPFVSTSNNSSLGQTTKVIVKTIGKVFNIIGRLLDKFIDTLYVKNISIRLNLMARDEGEDERKIDIKFLERVAYSAQTSHIFSSAEKWKKVTNSKETEKGLIDKKVEDIEAEFKKELIDNALYASKKDDADKDGKIGNVDAVFATLKMMDETNKSSDDDDDNKKKQKEKEKKKSTTKLSPEEKLQLRRRKKKQHERKEYDNRLLRIFTGIWVYFGQRSEIAVVCAFVLNLLVQRNIISCIFTIILFGYVILTKKSIQFRLLWKLMEFAVVALIVFRLIAQLPFFCVSQTESSKMDRIKVGVMDTFVKDNVIVCNGAEPTNNLFSWIYALGFFRVDSYIGSGFVLDILCFFTILLHQENMKITAIWSHEYKMKQMYLHSVVLDYNRERNDGKAKHFYVKTKRRYMDHTNEDYVTYKKNEIFVVVGMIRNTGDLIVKDFKNDDGKEKLMRIEDAKLFMPETENVDTDREHSTLSIQHNYVRYFEIPNDESIAMEFEQNSNESDEEKDDEEEEKEMYEEVREEIEIMEAKLKDEYMKIRLSLFYRIYRSVVRNVKKFFYTLFQTTNTKGKDFYIEMMLNQVLCFIYLVIFQPFFIKSVGFFLDYFTDNYIPFDYLFGAFIEFLFLLVDRIVYLKKSIPAKLILQYLSIIIYHILIFMVYPHQSERKGSDLTLQTAFLIILYLIKVHYWYVSAQQIKAGYCKIRISKFYSHFSSIWFRIYNFYYGFPFLFEIKSMMDWIFTPTSLKYDDYFKVEDVRTGVYLEQCDKIKEGEMKVNELGLNENQEEGTTIRKESKLKGEARTVWNKCYHGCLWLIIILTVLWAPLFLMSSLSSTFIQAAPESIEIQIGFDGTNNFFTQDQIMFEEMKENEIETQIKKAVGEDFLEQEGNDKFFKAKLDLQSATYWSMTPENYYNLNKTMCEGKPEDVSLMLRVTMRREDSAAASTFNLEEMKKLTEREMKGFCNKINGIRDEAFNIKYLPKMFIMPTLEETEISLEDDFKMELYPYLELDNKTNLYYWTFQTPNKTSEEIFYIAAPNVPKDNFLSFISGLGIIGIYTVIVIGVYEFISAGYSGLAQTIQFEEFDSGKVILILCNDVSVARQYGDLELEERLVDQIFQIYRNPAVLHTLTRD